MNKKNDILVKHICVFNQELFKQFLFCFLLGSLFLCGAQTEERSGQQQNEKPLSAGTRKPEANPAVKPEPADIEKDVAKNTYLGNFTHPWDIGDAHELLEFEFEEAELSGFIKYIEEHFNITFITDDIIKAAPKGGKSIIGTKINFKTNKPFTKKDTWALFLKFLDIAGATATPGPAPHIYKITSIDPKSPIGAAKSPLPTYIGTNPKALPDNDQYIRFVYFARDVSVDTVKSVLDSMRSATSPDLIMIPELNGVMIVDKAYNIKTMFNIVVELDTVTMPETMSIIKLNNTDAKKVSDLYQALMKEEEQKESLASRIMGTRRAQTLSYFPPGTRVIPEPRTNTLILLGSEDAVKKIEDFIVYKIDKQIERPYAPIHVYTLKHVQAQAVAEILMKVVKYQSSDNEGGKVGGVRNGDQYFKPGVTIIPEQSGNRLIITADYESYLKIHEVLEKIDVEQPQVAIKVLIIDLDVTDAKNFGTQIRNKEPGVNGLISDQVNFQTSGLAGTGGIVQNTSAGSTGATRLLGNLVTLATGGAVGSTYLTLGADCYGVWGILSVLQSLSITNIISNPFLVTTNNYPAQISLGTTRRIIMGNTITQGVNQPSYDDLKAAITVTMTPQISYEGFINLNVTVTDNQFTNGVETNGNRTERAVATQVILANNEVLALGGLTQDTFTETETKVPVLGDLPVVGWLFKNKQTTKTRVSTIVLIEPEIIPTADEDIAHKFTASIVKNAESTMTMSDYKGQGIDPVHRWFFNDLVNEPVVEVRDFVNHEKKYILPHQKEEVEKKHIKRLSDFL